MYRVLQACRLRTTLTGIGFRSLIQSSTGGIHMAVGIEKDGPVWTVIHDRPEARNAMDPESADALTAAFLEFESDKDAAVAVFFGAGRPVCAGWDLLNVR